MNNPKFETPNTKAETPSTATNQSNWRRKEPTMFNLSTTTIKAFVFLLITLIIAPLAGCKGKSESALVGKSELQGIWTTEDSWNRRENSSALGYYPARLILLEGGLGGMAYHTTFYSGGPISVTKLEPISWVAEKNILLLIHMHPRSTHESVGLFEYNISESESASILTLTLIFDGGKSVVYNKQNR